MKHQKDANERRARRRFGMERDVRYKLLQDDVIVAQGNGQTVDISSSGVSFLGQHSLTPGAFVELSIGWPVLLEGSCPMRLIVFGRVVRNDGFCSACTIDKYEFRTQGRRPGENPIPIRNDAMLLRWAETVRSKPLEARTATA
jgi:hypothetical protein